MSDSWDGHIGGFGEADLFNLVGQNFELRLPDVARHADGTTLPSM